MRLRMPTNIAWFFDFGDGAMQRGLQRLFPIHDVPSAGLMKLKAECLLRAGVIDRSEKQVVDIIADAILGAGHAVCVLAAELERPRGTTTTH
jgi:hypothetical protein